MTRLNLRWSVLARLSVVLFAIVILGAPSARAQATDSGTVTGTVTDPTGAVIPDVVITLTDPTTKIKRTTVSNKQGLYFLVDVLPGDYDITAVKAGFSTDEIPVLTVSVATQTTANFKMAVGAESTTVEVQASNADLQTMNASTGTTVDQAQVESLPTIGREVASFMTMQPGVAPGGQTAGTTVDQTTFTLDGGSNSSDMDGTANVYTTSFASSTTGGFLGAGPQGTMPMPQDSVEEFKVTTTGQTAEFNNSSGSQSQVITKRGHDKWHGTGYEYYLNNSFNGNTWGNNFPLNGAANFPTDPVTNTNLGGTSYTAKPSYHYSRFGGAAGGPIAPFFLGGKTYLFANYEGFRYPLAATYERTVPSYQYLQQGQLTFTGQTLAGCGGGATCTATQLKNADPRGIGMNPVLTNFYKTQLPVAPVSNNGPVGATGTSYAGTFDSSCGALSTSYCDSVNTVGYKVNVLTPISSDFLASRLDHDFGAKWHLMLSYRYYHFINLTSNQVDIGGGIPGDKVGVGKALTPRPQQPMYIVAGLTTNISSTLTNDFHFSFLRNFWQWKGAGAPPQIAGAGGVVEPLGESSNTTVLAPFNVNAQNIRTRIWDGKDIFFTDNLTKLKGDHLIQVGGQFQRNDNYHQRTDNGASINYTPTYQIGDAGGGGNVAYAGTATSAACAGAGAGLGCVGANANVNYARILDTYYGIVTDTQVANTYTNNGGTLTQNAPATPISAHTKVPYYNIYVTDTWHAKPGLTVNYGISYAVEMPPTEAIGSQVMFTDVAGNAIYLDQYLAQRKTSALSGQVYNPEIGFALLKNVQGNRKYAYDPYYGGFSPRVSFAWNPTFKSAGLNKIFGTGSTVLRGGYSRIYGRINGDVETLNPILSPGLILATQCKYVQTSNTCLQTGFNDTSVYRFGVDGVTPVLAAAAPPATLPQPYHPGYDGPGVALASPVDPSLRPNDVDTFNLSLQRQINRKMLVEVGYIGRLIHHEYIMKNPNVIPYMMSQGGQTFAAAYGAIEGAFGCTISASLCAKSATPATTTTSLVTAQPFFETALAGTGYCTGYINCTAAVVVKQAANFRAQKVFSIWQALDNNTATNGFNFGRSLMGTATSNTTFGSAGQVVTGLSEGTADGFSNYHGGYVTFKATDFHGITLQENLTYAKALGLGAYNQSTSSQAAEDSFNLGEQYGRQGFDQKIIFNTFIVWQTPWYKQQHGIAGRAFGGWILSPVVTAGTGQPLTCATNNSGQNFGGEDGSNFTDTENCVFINGYKGGYHTHRGVYGGYDSANGVNNVAVGTNVHPGTAAAAINMFTNPVGVWQNVRPPVLGIDTRDGGYGPISGLGYLNMDFSIKKKIVIYEKYALEVSGVFQNVMNHLDFNSPSLSLASSSSFGVTKSQGNSPRTIQGGVRAYF